MVTKIVKSIFVCFLFTWVDTTGILFGKEPCIVCNEKLACTQFFDCFHETLCSECFAKWGKEKKEKATCPLCRRQQKIGEYLQIHHIIINRTFKLSQKNLEDVDINAKDSEGYTPLHYASLDPSGKNINILIQNGADVNSRNNTGQTPLHLSVQNDSTGKITAILLGQPTVDVDAQDENGSTVLHYAVRKASPGMIDLLLRHGASAEIQDINGHTPLELAKKNALEDDHYLLLCIKLLEKVEHNGEDSPN